MNNLDNGFARAQRAYERQLPPEPPEEIECPECEGEGEIPCSNCCESEIRNGTCMECGHKCTWAKCPTCEGRKTIPIKVKEERDYDENE